MKYYTTDGNVKELEVRSYSLEEINAMVGGYFEFRNYTTDEKFIKIFCNEEAKIKKLPINDNFMKYLELHYGGFHPVLTKLRGNIILFETEDELTITDS